MEDPPVERKPSRTELRDEYRRRVFQVFCGDEWMCSYGDIYFMQPEAASPTRDYSLEDVVADLVRDFDDPDGTDARDMAVWKDGRILAVVRRGNEGKPEVITFQPGG
jgi:hypothetical protein